MEAIGMDDEQDRYWTSLTNSLPRAKLPARNPTSPAPAGLDRSIWIGEMARQIFGSYRRDDWADPEMALKQMGMVLERYPDKVVRTVSHPLTGIQRTCKFPPSIAEFVE